MARRRCPGCGAWYSGRQCPECLYVTFEAEETRSSFTEQQETPKYTPQPIRSRQMRHRSTGGRKLFLIALISVILIFFTSTLGIILAMGNTVSIAPEPEPVVMPENGTVLYSNNGLLITADWEEGSPIDGNIRLIVQNDTAQDLSINTTAVAVNGCMQDSVFFYCDAPHHALAEGTLWIDPEELAGLGIGSVENVRGLWDIYDADTYEAVLVDQQFLLSTDGGGDYIQPLDDSGQVLLDQEGIRLVYQGWDTDEYGGLRFRFYIENGTGENLYCTSSEVSLDGREADLYLWQNLLPDTHGYCYMELYDLEELGIESLEQADTLEFSIQVSDSLSWETVYESEILTVDINP